jgi:hypothetical protein
MRPRDEWRWLVNRAVRWIRTYMRGSEEECPEKTRFGL